MLLESVLPPEVSSASTKILAGSASAGTNSWRGTLKYALLESAGICTACVEVFNTFPSSPSSEIFKSPFTGAVRSETTYTAMLPSSSCGETSTSL